jgi:hypothetical protein
VTSVLVEMSQPESPPVPWWRRMLGLDTGNIVQVVGSIARATLAPCARYICCHRRRPRAHGLRMVLVCLAFHYPNVQNIIFTT